MTKPSLWAALALAAGASVARAEDPTARGFDADTMHPALGLSRGIAVETATAEPAGNWAAGLRLDWMQGFLALTVDDRRDQLMESRLTAHVMGVRAFRWFEVAADLPVILHQRADFSLLTDAGVSGPLVAPVETTTLGDLRLTGKVPVLGPSWPVALAALLDLRLPTGDPDSFASDGLVFAPSVVASRPLGPVRIDAQVGYLFRDQGQYAQLVVQDAFTWGVGASTALPALWRLSDWRAHAELVGNVPRGYDLDTTRYRPALQAAAGLRIGVARGWEVEVGGTTGLGPPGYGQESWRVFAGVRYAKLGKDTDGDGVTDDDDWCPGKPGIRGNHGCPEGAIDFDADRDGVPLPDDKCPEVKGSADMDGCPDTDLDFIPDPQDACPEEPGPATNDGCPVGDEDLVEIEDEKLSLKDAINFDTGKDTILPRSDRILDSIAAILKANPDIPRVRVEGHTDDVGAEAYNMDLSQRRAQSVVNALVRRGIDAAKLLPVGYGESRPLATPRTSKSLAVMRALNRRVEFTILQAGEGAEK